MNFSNPPLSEMSIAVQFREPLGFSTNRVFSLYPQISSRFPKIELMPVTGPLGVSATSFLRSSTSPEERPRYWFSSEDGTDLLQVQDDLVAINWRRMKPLPGPPAKPYPGFQNMLAAFNDSAMAALRFLRQGDTPPLYAINLLYDNIWPLPEQLPLEKIFRFWRTVGVRLGGGPQISMQIMLDEKASGRARLDVTATVGAVPGTEQKPIRVGRLILAAFSFTEQFSEFETSIRHLHEQVEQHFRMIVADDAKAGWHS